MRPRLVYLVTEDWYFLMHRLPMARAAKAAGYEVHVVTRIDRGRAAIEAEGFTVHHADLARGSRRLDRIFASVRAVRAHYHAIRPNIVHHVALQCAVVGSLAAAGMRLPTVNALTGLGTLFTANEGLVPLAVKLVMPRLLNVGPAKVVVENPDDGRLLQQMGVAADRIVLVSSSGVDIDRLVDMPEPEGPVTFAYAGRMLAIKGVRTVVAAYRALHADDGAPRLLLAGTPDPFNRTSLSAQEMEDFAAQPGITWLGHVDDIRTVWQRAHVGVIASRGGEGVPVSLLEAAACGRPLIATDVPGCREIAQPGVNALRVPADDPIAFAGAMRELASNAALRRKLAAGSRPLVEARFSSQRVGREIVALYDGMVAAASRNE